MYSPCFLSNDVTRIFFASAVLLRPIWPPLSGVTLMYTNRNKLDYPSFYDRINYPSISAFRTHNFSDLIQWEHPY